jgi:hypothetical protein
MYSEFQKANQEEKETKARVAVLGGGGIVTSQILKRLAQEENIILAEERDAIMNMGMARPPQVNMGHFTTDRMYPKDRDTKGYLTYEQAKKKRKAQTKARKLNRKKKKKKKK